MKEKELKKIDAYTEFEDIDITEYPYIGIGKKNKKKNYLTEDQLESLINR